MKNRKLLLILVLITVLITTTSVFAKDENETDKLPYDPEKAIVLLGDANEDGVVDNIDVALLRQFMLGDKTEYDINITNSDCNEDGIVDNIDVAILRQFMLGEITLG